MTRVAVLVWDRPGTPRPPEQHLYGRAALALRGDGIELVFVPVSATTRDIGASDRVSGLVADRGGWRAVTDVVVVAIYDRLPGRRRGAEAGLFASRRAVPIANPPRVTTLCRDKPQMQRVLEAAGLLAPAIELDHDRFAERLARWPAAFLKPARGSCGRGVERWTAADVGRPIPEADDDGRRFLQRAVLPPKGWRSVCVRALVQRQPDGQWWMAPLIARASRSAWVATNRTQALVLPASDIHGAEALEGCRKSAREVCRALDSPALVELGIDLAVDPEDTPWVLEVNSQPRGRLEQLADRDPDRYQADHIAVCQRPLRYLAAAFA